MRGSEGVTPLAASKNVKLTQQGGEITSSRQKLWTSHDMAHRWVWVVTYLGIPLLGSLAGIPLHPPGVNQHPICRFEVMLAEESRNRAFALGLEVEWLRQGDARWVH